MPEATDLPSSSRALVTLMTNGSEAHRRPAQRASSFVAQLIANARGLPQTRERRRADASEVIAAYRATIDRIHKLNDQ